MSIQVLGQIAATPLPASFKAAEDIDAIKILRQAGLVIAVLEQPPEGVAKVLAITDEGRAELLRFHCPQMQRSQTKRGLGSVRVVRRGRGDDRASGGDGDWLQWVTRRAKEALRISNRP